MAVSTDYYDYINGNFSSDPANGYVDVTYRDYITSNIHDSKKLLSKYVMIKDINMQRNGFNSLSMMDDVVVDITLSFPHPRSLSDFTNLLRDFELSEDARREFNKRLDENSDLKEAYDNLCVLEKLYYGDSLATLPISNKEETK